MGDEHLLRFRQLLQPIRFHLSSHPCFIIEYFRDLSKNWSVDIAKELEIYLEEIEEITFTFRGGESNLNFAEAALLIQVCSFYPLIYLNGEIRVQHVSIVKKWNICTRLFLRHCSSSLKNGATRSPYC